MPVVERFLNLLNQLPRSMKRRLDKVFRHVGLVGKVDPRLDQRQRSDQLLAPALRLPAEHAGELPHRLRALRLGLGRHEVREALDGGQVEPTVLERAPRELARLRGTKARQLDELGLHGGDHRPAPVQMQLGHVLSRFGVRRRKPQHERLVEHRAGRRIAQAAQRCAPWLGQLGAEHRERIARARARNAHDRNRRRQPAGGEGEDGGAVGAHA